MEQRCKKKKKKKKTQLLSNREDFIKTTTFIQTTTELRSCVEVEVAALGSPSLISLMVSVDVKQR